MKASQVKKQPSFSGAPLYTIGKHLYSEDNLSGDIIDNDLV
jgi:hypothetical protein